MDDDFLVYPFRRQLVEETLVEPLPARLPARARPVVARPAPPRRPSPLRWALPAAVAAFLVALAGAATISHPTEVQNAIQDQIVPAAQAAPRPRRHRLAPPRHLFVPDVTGLKGTRATRLLKQSRFRPHVKLVVGKVGVVLAQKPKAATDVKKAGVVLLLVGKAKPRPRPVVIPTVIVTSVVGLTRDVAAKALRTEGLGVRIVGVPSRQPRGTVVAQAPASGSRVEAGSFARINVSVG